MKEIDLLKATPGSDYAIDNGCTCPVLDNAHGKGYLGIPDQFVINALCPLHADIDDCGDVADT